MDEKQGTTNAHQGIEHAVILVLATARQILLEWATSPFSAIYDESCVSPSVAQPVAVS